MAGRDDPLRIGDDGAVVHEHVHVVLGREQRADVAVEDEVRLDGSLDRLLDVGIGGMHKVPHPRADLLLPLGKPVEVGVDPGVLDVRHAITLRFGTCRRASTLKVGGYALRFIIAKFYLNDPDNTKFLPKLLDEPLPLLIVPTKEG